MENKEGYTVREKILLIIQGISLTLFSLWFEFAFEFEGIETFTIIFLSVTGTIFVISHLIYIQPIIKAKKVRKQDFFNSINYPQHDIFDEYDINAFEEYDKEVFDDKNKEQ